jgi:uncharacterized damage-inducible protein DinB
MSKSQSQSAFIDQLETQLEEQLKEVISVFQNLPTEALLQPGSNNGWSIAQCFAHLNSYADFYIPRITKAMDNAPSANEVCNFRHRLLGRYFISSMDPDLSKKKFKAMKKHLPAAGADPHHEVARFIAHLENLLALSRKAREKKLERTSVSTSIASWLKINAGDALAFLIVHNKRHLKQARQLVRQA